MAGMNRKCPACRQPIAREDCECSRCGAQLYILCPSCGRRILIQSNCRYCRASLYVICPNKECRQSQLISPDGRCRSCGAQISQ